MLSNQISPSDKQLLALQSYPKNTPLVMLNILRFKDKVNSEETGKEVYKRYLKNAMPFVQKAGAKLIWKGKVYSTVVGGIENQPQLVLLVEYPNVATFFKMISNPAYQKIAEDRKLALEYGGLIACQNSN